MDEIYYSDNPFIAVQEILEKIKDEVKIIVLDFHAQSTGEKFTLGYYLDGKVSACYGTHTHVQTADEMIMPKGTAFITDIGMTGPSCSDLGNDTENSLKRYLNDMPVKDILSTNKDMINGCIFDIDQNTGKAVTIKRIHID